MGVEDGNGSIPFDFDDTQGTRAMGVRDYLYETTDRQAESKYPSWKDGDSNLFSFLDAINKSQPIVQSQYEMVWSRWPRTRFFAKGFSVPGIAVATQEINHAGFTISIPTHVKYETTEVNFTIIADKEGYHYYDIRNMVLQSGHPLIAGDTKSEVGTTEDFNTFDSEDFIEVWVRNHQKDAVGHHWVIHDFRPTKIGDIELSQDGSGFVEFEVTGTFTHITYDCGKTIESVPEQKPNENEGGDQPEPNESPSSEESGEGGGEEGGAVSGDDETYYEEEDWEDTEIADIEDEPGIEYDEEDFVSDEPFDDDWEDWNDDDWGDDDWPEDEPSQFSISSNGLDITTENFVANGNEYTITKMRGYTTPEELQKVREDAKTVTKTATQMNEQTNQQIQKVAEAANSQSGTSQQSGSTQQTSSSKSMKVSVNGKEYSYTSNLDLHSQVLKDKLANTKNTVKQQQIKRQIQLIEYAANQQQQRGGGLKKRDGEQDIIKPLTPSKERQLLSLMKAVKSNHDIQGSNFRLIVTPTKEIEEYKQRITQMSLPKRFGMYKTPKTYQKRDDEVELAEPEEEISPSYTPPEGHKTRPIFN